MDWKSRGGHFYRLKNILQTFQYSRDTILLKHLHKTETCQKLNLKHVHVVRHVSQLFISDLFTVHLKLKTHSVVKQLIENQNICLI